MKKGGVLMGVISFVQEDVHFLMRMVQWLRLKGSGDSVFLLLFWVFFQIVYLNSIFVRLCI